MGMNNPGPSSPPCPVLPPHGADHGASAGPPVPPGPAPCQTPRSLGRGPPRPSWCAAEVRVRAPCHRPRQTLPGRGGPGQAAVGDL